MENWVPGKMAGMTPFQFRIDQWESAVDIKLVSTKCNLYIYTTAIDNV